jgi:hypothetical protein
MEPITIHPGVQLSQSRLRIGDRQFDLASLYELQTQQSSHDPLTRNAAILTGSGALLFALAARHMSPAGLAAALTVLTGLAVVVLISSHHRPRRQELWASYQGRWVKLFSSDDPWLYGAIARQVRRCATEARLANTVPRRRPPGLIRPTTPATMRSAATQPPGGSANTGGSARSRENVRSSARVYRQRPPEPAVPHPSMMHPSRMRPGD